MADRSAVSDALAIARYHIVLVAMVAAVTFGWLMTGKYYWFIAPVVGLDWFFINLLNRVTDIEEDLKNKIPGTERVARKKRVLTIACFTAMLVSFVVGHVLCPGLTPWRLAVQAIGLGYNYDVVPTPKGLSRFKEIYFFKNFGSSVLFVLTCFVYPLAVDPQARLMGWPGIVTLALFFVPYELTFEILYDLRDIEGDRAENVPTYPVVHGAERARQIIDALLAFSAGVIVFGFAMKWIGARELLMLAAPPIQLVFYRPRYKRGLTPHDCILLTHMASALVVFYMIGNAVWLRAGLPANVYW